jgi:ankyrin repeat protein
VALMKKDLADLIKDYRRCPEFLFVDLVDPNQPGMTGDTMLHTAVIRGASEDVDVLIASGARVNAVGDLGYTALHHAASRGLLEIAKKLLGYGADRNLKNEFGQTPLALATLQKCPEIVAVLKGWKKGDSEP